MKLIKPTILAACANAQAIPFMHPQSKADFAACAVAATDAQTIIFSSEQMMVLRPALDRYGSAETYKLPFPAVILQFTAPIPELTFLSGAINTGTVPFFVTPADEDAIAALVLNQHQDPLGGRTLNTAVAYYASSSINRATWYDAGDVATNIAPNQAADPDQAAAQIRDKRTIQRMAIAAVAYINCENIVLERQEAPPAVNRKRERRGKQILEPYYLCGIREPSGRISHATGAGSQHGHRYDVRGHFRRLASGKTIWVRAHQRGLEHELYVPKTYRRN